MDWQQTRQFLSPCFPEEIRSELDMLMPGELQEIRVRAERPTVFVTASRVAELAWKPGQLQLEALAEALSEHSLYARSEETRQGYVTLRGGHRMGLCGRVVQSRQGRALQEIGSICIRIASQWPDCAAPLLTGSVEPRSILLIGPPGSGKTTLLRDLARIMGSSSSLQSAVVDERGELAACVGGIPQLDVGDCTDVLDGLSKTTALPWLVRSMAPDVIVTDELAGPEDCAAVMDAMACGAAVCASVHGTSLQQAASRPALAAMMSHRLFDQYAVLSRESPGQIAALYDRSGSPLEAI